MSGNDRSQVEQWSGVGNERRQRLPNRRASELETFEHQGFRFDVGTSRYDDGRLAEIFLNVSGKSGTPLDVGARDAAITASLYLQRGGDVDELRHALTRDSNGRASGALGRFLDTFAARQGGADGP